MKTSPRSTRHVVGTRRGPPRTALITGVIALAGAMVLSSGIATAASLAPVATTAQASSVLPTSAVINGSVKPNGTATNWYVQYGLTTNAAYGSQTASKTVAAGLGTVQVTSSISGLSPATSYHYRVVASSSEGTSFGGNGTFNTSAAPAVVTNAASLVTSTSTTLNAIINPEGLATNWYFEFGPTKAYGTKTATKSLAAGGNDIQVSVSIGNLNAQATYHYRVVASSSAGSTYGDDLVVVTGEPLTLNSSLAIITYRGFVTLSGVLENGLAGQQVTIDSQRFDAAAFTGLATTTTGNGGTWSYIAQPTARTTYKAVVSNGSSSPVVVSVRPTVSLTVGKTNHLTTSVSAVPSFGSHVLQLQRLSAGTWVMWKSVRLSPAGVATFTTSLPKGSTAIRMAIGPFVVGIDQAAPGYLAGFSRTLIYRH